mmetsp:Transcript_35622/g.74137  ORF Transcript_35622/g.74137 Transcript_35622/m.74137 type:complete len:398 (-) Transcript_35622:125-1318(-)
MILFPGIFQTTRRLLGHQQVGSIGRLEFLQQNGSQEFVEHLGYLPFHRGQGIGQNGQGHDLQRKDLFFFGIRLFDNQIHQFGSHFVIWIQKFGRHLTSGGGSHARGIGQRGQGLQCQIVGIVSTAVRKHLGDHGEGGRSATGRRRRDSIVVLVVFGIRDQGQGVGISRRSGRRGQSLRGIQNGGGNFVKIQCVAKASLDFDNNAVTVYVASTIQADPEFHTRGRSALDARLFIMIGRFNGALPQDGTHAGGHFRRGRVFAKDGRSFEGMEFRKRRDGFQFPSKGQGLGWRVGGRSSGGQDSRFLRSSIQRGKIHRSKGRSHGRKTNSGTAGGHLTRRTIFVIIVHAFLRFGLGIPIRRGWIRSAHCFVFLFMISRNSNWPKLLSIEFSVFLFPNKEN